MASSFTAPNDYEDDDDEYILALILTYHEKFFPSRNRKAFYRLLGLEDRRRRQKKIPTLALLHPHQSAWRRLYYSGSDSALITLTGLDNTTFQVLH